MKEMYQWVGKRLTIVYYSQVPYLNDCYSSVFYSLLLYLKWKATSGESGLGGCGKFRLVVALGAVMAGVFLFLGLTFGEKPGFRYTY